MAMTGNTSPKRGNVARRITLAQRRVLLRRIRAEVAGVVEEIEGTAESLRAIGGAAREATETDRATMRLIESEQRRQQMELRRLFGEYESLALRELVGDKRREAAA
jgi:hypothetical protein